MRLALIIGLQVALQASALAEPNLEKLRHGFEAVDAWRVDEAREYAEELYKDHPEHPMVLALVGEVKLHMSDYAGAVEFFVAAKAGGAPDTVLGNAGLAEAARVATQGYAEVVGKHFIIRHPPGKDAVLVPFAMETLDAALERISELLGWRPHARIVMEFYPSASTLAKVSTLTEQDIKNSGTIALCKWNRLMATSPRGVVFGYGWRDTIAHELVHLIIGGASKNTVPIWLHEGIAKYAETAWRGEPGLALSVEAQERLRSAAKKNELIPFEKMHPSMAKLKTQEETSLAFAEVFTFIEYMVQLKGWGAIREILKRMADGESEEAAIATVFGKPLDQLSKAWIATLSTREIRREGRQLAAERRIEVKDRADTPDDKLHGISKEARKLARVADLLYSRGRLNAAKVELEKAYALTKAPLLAAKLGNVALAAGDFEATERAARLAIEGVPDLPGPHVTLAEALVRKDDKAGAKAALEAAIAINPFDPRIHALRLATMDDKTPEEKRAEAQIALMILSGDITGRPPILGTGGLVRLDALPFSRVFVEKDLDGHVVVVPIGMVTPTAPFPLRPGTIQIRLVPPRGETMERTITVTPTGPDGEAQRISANPQGS